jgi:peptidoglycan/xylan/chitin deacetylase (PgdA/CDA1 family)
MTAIVLAYHAIEAGPPPLCIEPDVFRDHLATIEDAGVRVVALGKIADGPDEPCVAITFDDGFASVVENAAPALLERGLPATVFCVAGHLGGANDWPGEPPPQRRLASAAELAACGIEIGSHGMTHLRLDRVSEAELQREVVDSRSALEDALGVAVEWFAYPRGSVAGRELVERTYAGACAVGNRALGPGFDRFELPRVEMHYLRRPSLLRHVLGGGRAYLALRRAGRRLVPPD